MLENDLNIVTYDQHPCTMNPSALLPTMPSLKKKMLTRDRSLSSKYLVTLSAMTLFVLCKHKNYK